MWFCIFGFSFLEAKIHDLVCLFGLFVLIPCSGSKQMGTLPQLDSAKGLCFSKRDSFSFLFRDWVKEKIYSTIIHLANTWFRGKHTVFPRYIEVLLSLSHGNFSRIFHAFFFFFLQRMCSAPSLAVDLVNQSTLCLFFCTECIYLPNQQKSLIVNRFFFLTMVWTLRVSTK